MRRNATPSRLPLEGIVCKNYIMEKGTKNLQYFMLLFWGYGLITWIVNLVQLLNCDFESPWKSEAIHAVGLIPIASMVTCWF